MTIRRACSGSRATTTGTFLNTKLRAPGEEQSSDEEGASEPTVADLVTALENRDQIFFPDQAVRLRPARAGFRDDVLGVALDAGNVYAVHNSRSAASGAIDGKGSLAVLDRKTLTVQAQIAVGLDARAVAVNPVTSRAYVVNRGTGTGSTLSVVNTATRKVIASINLGQVGVDVAVNTKLNRVYISNPGQEDIQVLNGANNALLAPVQVGKGLGGHGRRRGHGHGLRDDEQPRSRERLRQARPCQGQRRHAQRAAVRSTSAIRASARRRRVRRAARAAVRRRLGGGNVAPSVIVIGATLGIELARIPVANPLRAISLNADTGQAFAAGDRGSRWSTRTRCASCATSTPGSRSRSAPPTAARSTPATSSTGRCAGSRPAAGSRARGAAARVARTRGPGGIRLTRALGSHPAPPSLGVMRSLLVFAALALAGCGGTSSPCPAAGRAVSESFELVTCALRRHGGRVPGDHRHGAPGLGSLAAGTGRAHADRRRVVARSGAGTACGERRRRRRVLGRRSRASWSRATASGW